MLATLNKLVFTVVGLSILTLLALELTQVWDKQFHVDGRYYMTIGIIITCGILYVILENIMKGKAK